MAQVTVESREMVLYEAQTAIIEQKRGNYSIGAPGCAPIMLKRDVDFGVIPRTKQPSLYKSGAEKVCLAFGLMKRFTVESAIEQAGKEPMFFYRVRCDLVKVAQNGQEYIFSNGHGSANTAEKRNGFNGPYDAANSALKMAEKRALVAAAISLANISDLFSQDQENEAFMNQANDLTQTTDDNAPITTKQMRRIYALAAEKGVTANEAKQKIIAAGFASSKDIKQKDYEEVCKLFE